VKFFKGRQMAAAFEGDTGRVSIETPSTEALSGDLGGLLSSPHGEVALGQRELGGGAPRERHEPQQSGLRANDRVDG
jgi:hypothetical protein